ncbi:TolC family protein [Abyssalbus ytuae]|uniref:TolC family protein n=1 Tax=Abyssalbus ytuae TaxID=2926907 RepID=A0A9E6ZJC6_9FLAO|nr:TolC family protein [Abyssalbus ytuae]UOB16637.1 TolC family protein [Abyssalbus ytuae]
MKMLKIVVYSFILFLSLTGYTQSLNIISLEECYELARENYPLIKQNDLIHTASDFSVDNIITENLPKVSLNAQATYQSEVTSLPVSIPNVNISSLDKDQYKIFAEISQNIYNGNRVDKKIRIEEISQDIQTNQLEIELYQVKKKISQLYFGILLTDEQLKQNKLQEKDIQIAIEKTQARINNGTAIESDFYSLNANLLSIRQKNTELNALKKAYTQMLSQFINKDLDVSIQLKKPEQELLKSEAINRLELDFFNKQKMLIDLQSQMLSVKVLPALSLFAQAGYGKPALNMLSNEFEGYLLGGVRLNWPLFNFYTNKNEKKINQIEKEKLEVEKETFLFNTNLELTNQNTEIEKYQQLLLTDDNIIEMYTNVKEIALFKLENGTIDVNDFLRDVNQESKAIQNKLVHEIKLLMIIEELKITRGL